LSQEGFLARNTAVLTSALESVMLNDKIARNGGFFQLFDPRLKVISTVIFIVIVGLARNILTLAFILALILILCYLTRVPIVFFIKRILLFIPIFTLVIVIPALFITPGEPFLKLGDKIIITEQGIRTAEFLFLRVTNSLSLGVLLILTTRWNNLLAALRWFRIPSLFVDVLGMTYRYIFLLLRTANSMFLARRSRTLGTFSATENRRWLVRTLGTILLITQHVSEEVYLAMISRGYQGETRVLFDFSVKARDFLLAACFVVIAIFLLWTGIKG
jgi:cobalt/nickel transport system permease protein